MIVGVCIGCIDSKQTDNLSKSFGDGNLDTSDNKQMNALDIDFSTIRILSPYNESASEWLKTNASFVAQIAVSDNRVQKLLQEGGIIEGVVYTCHPTPENYSGPGCAPALRIQSNGKIIDFLVDEEEGKVIEIVMENIQDEKSVEALIKDLRDENKNIRSSAAETLSWTGDESAVEPLIEALDDEESDVRMHAATALEEIGDERAIDRLAQALNDKDEDLRVREASAFALGSIYTPGMTGNKNVVEPLIEALSDENADIRIRAAIVLGQIEDKKAVDSLIQALNDENWEVRMHAAYALGRIGDEKAVKSLIQTLNDENTEVRKNAAHAMGDIGDSTAVDPLIQTLENKNEDGAVRSDAAQALGKIGDERAIWPLNQALKDENDHVRKSAENALLTLNSSLEDA